MRTDSREFNLSGLERVVSGAGSVERLSHELERRGLERAVVVTGRTLGASALLDRVTAPLGSGVQNMSDRLAALGGKLFVRSSPGEGTTVEGRVSVRSDFVAQSETPASAS